MKNLDKKSSDKENEKVSKTLLETAKPSNEETKGELIFSLTLRIRDNFPLEAMNSDGEWEEVI